MTSKLKKLQQELAELQAELKMDLKLYAEDKEKLKNNPGDAGLKDDCVDWREMIADHRGEIKEVKAAIAVAGGKAVERPPSTPVSRASKSTVVTTRPRLFTASDRKEPVPVPARHLLH